VFDRRGKRLALRVSTTPMIDLSRCGGTWRYTRDDRRLTVTWDIAPCARRRSGECRRASAIRYFHDLDSLLVYQALLERALIRAHWLPIDYVCGYAGDPCNVNRRRCAAALPVRLS
jgi:hypothetical protein